jgi:twitching motility protein PilT
LAPNRQPLLQLPDGQDLNLLANPLPPTLIEMLAKEVLPPHMEHHWRTKGEAKFQYETGGERYQLNFSRSMEGILIAAEPEARPTAPIGLAPLALDPPPARPEPPRMAAPVPAPTPLAAPAPLAVPAPLPAPAPLAVPAPLPAPAPLAVQFEAPAPAPRRAVAVSAEPPPGLPAATGSHPLADELFSTLLARGGSDIHCSSFEAPIARISGDLDDLTEFGILGPNKILEVMEAIAPRHAWDQFQARNDADFAYPFEPGQCRLRVNFFQDRLGPGFVCRVIPNEIPNPDRLGLEDPIRQLAHLQKGLVLVTGPTGSGKSTTLAAIIDLANQQRNDHILTIEDPIEFVHPRKRCLVNQREVGTHTESFKSGLRAALREDPDIVLVGEMRDLETIAIALETAVTGHLVFGTLHTSSAVGTIDRIVDQFPADRQQQIRVMLADSLKCVISQILLKRNGGGRIAALESLFITPAIANLIREGKNFQITSAMQTGRAYGQRLMNDALIEMIQSDRVAIKEAFTRCPDKETFMQALKRANIDWDPRNMPGWN